MTVEEYLSRKRGNASSDMIYLLSLFDSEKAKSPDEVFAKHGREFTKSNFEDAVRELMRLGFLIKEDDAQTNIRQSRLSFWHWQDPARSFFFSTKDCHAVLEKEEKAEYINFLSDASPQPQIYKIYRDKPIIALRKPAELSGSLQDALMARKSAREFIPKPITLKQLESVLFNVWGEQGKIKSEFFGELLHKTSASGGARHPIEVYPIVFNAEGLEKGVYHYNVKDHALEKLKTGDFRNDLFELATRQVWIRDCAVCFAMTAVFERASWKYRHGRGLRNMFLDAG